MPFYKPIGKTPASVLLERQTLKCGLRHGVFSPNGNKYTGEWQNNQKHGRGTQVWKQSGAIYNGEWKFGKRHGWGNLSELVQGSNEHVKKYCGQWENDKKHGHGTYFYKSSAVYVGEWSEGQRSGWGKMHYENGDIYEGQWMNDKKHGSGLIRYANGNWHEGNWRNDEKNGTGKLYFVDKGQLYTGIWVNGSAKCGSLTDCGRDEAPTPTEYPIPKVHLVDPEMVLQEVESACLKHLTQ